MNTKKLSSALGGIDERYIGEAAVYTAKKSRPWLKWGSLAACLILLSMTVALVLPLLTGRELPPPEKKYYDYGIIGGTFSSYIGGGIVSEEKIGDKLEDVSVSAGWKNSDGEWVTAETLAAEVYEIRGIGTNIAAALRFTEKGEAVSASCYYVITPPNAEYNGMLFPDYKTENPVRYLEESAMGKCNGWQDLGTDGEIRTITVPIGSTYIYQMYSYYIRNDLSHIYAREDLPARLEDLPLWLSDTLSVGRRSFWYSMGNRAPVQITLQAADSLTSENGEMTFLRAEYQVKLLDGSREKQEDWIVYFMEQDGIYSAFAVLANTQNEYDFVRSYSESIVKSYQKKSAPSD